jgi:hypothetical protein
VSTPKDDLPGFGADSSHAPISQEEVDDIEARLDAVRAEKLAALADPGPSWSEWFFFHGAKWYMTAAFLIPVAWEIASLFAPANVPGYEIGPVLAGTFYAEFMLYQYLWHRPSSHPSRSLGARSFRPTWYRPVQYGRWTPEGTELRAGRPVVSVEEGPDPREFV